MKAGKIFLSCLAVVLIFLPCVCLLSEGMSGEALSRVEGQTEVYARIVEEESQTESSESGKAESSLPSQSSDSSAVTTGERNEVVFALWLIIGVSLIMLILLLPADTRKNADGEKR